MPSPGGEPAFLQDLNDAQRQAVLHDSGPLAVLAGPGTGKTRVIVHRVARAVAPVEQGGLGADPESVLALAFTIKSAEELRTRLAGMFVRMGLSVGHAERLRASTVHAFGYRLVRRYADRLDLPSNLVFLDSAQQKRLLRDLVWSNDLFRHLAAQGRETALEAAARFIGACRNDAVTPERAREWVERRRDLIAKGLDPEELDDRGEPAPIEDDARADALRAAQPTHEDHARLLALYDERLLRDGAVAHDDLIALPSKLLREDADVAALVRDDHRHIVVDEFQDWNVAQIELLTLLAPPGRNPDVCVVGDDDQSIYAFRGADDRAFERFAKTYPTYQKIALTKNYRSAPVIVRTANSIIDRANRRFDPDKVVEPGRPDDACFASARIEGVTHSPAESDGAAIAAMILLDRAEHGRRYGGFAVIARSGTHLDQIGAELSMQGIPIDRRDGGGALDNEFVQDLRAWEEAVADPLCAPGGSPRRILWRAPISMPIADIQRYEREFAMLTRDEGEPRPYLEWLVAAHASDERVERFRVVFDACRAAAAEHNADVALDTIAREAVLPSLDALSEGERLRAGSAVARYVAFVRDKQPNLPAPGDLGEWRKYFVDLSDKERASLAPGGERSVDCDDADERDADAVRLLTAHSAKGLEFDTVFLPRVRPGMGMFPSSNAGDDGDLPPDLAARTPCDASDEERRLFYVACTRAERRLVLLAKEKKGKGEGKLGDYFLQLTEQAEPDLRVPVTAAADWLAKAGGSMHAPTDALDHEGAADALDRMLRAERHRASSLLHRAQTLVERGEELPGIERQLAETARRVAALGRLRAGVAKDDMPAPLRETIERTAALKAYVERAGKGLSDSLAPLAAPLALSYSKLEDFRRCGLCFYVKHVLGLDEPKTAELAVGGIVHAALEKFYNERGAAEADGRFPPGRERLLELGAIEFERQASRAAPNRAAMREQTLAMLAHAFDSLHSDDDHVLETELNIVLRLRLPGEADDAPPHRFVAKIDRLDLLPSGGFRIVDYKTGAATKKKLEIGKTDEQMSLYALALSAWVNAGSPSDGEAHDPIRLDEIEPVVGETQYWVLSTGQRGSAPLGHFNLEKAVESTHAAARAMLAGEYEKGRDCKGLCAYLGR